MIGVEAIASLIPIHLHLQKLNRCLLLWVYLLSSNHIINLLLESRDPNTQESHCLLLDKLMPRQCSSIKDLLVNMDNKFNKVFPSFSSFNYESLLGNRLIDIFPNHFHFTLWTENNHNIKSHLWCLNNITIQASRTRLLCQYPIFTVIIIQSSKLYIMQLRSHLLKPNFCNKMWYQPSHPSF